MHILIKTCKKLASSFKLTIQSRPGQKSSSFVTQFQQDLIIFYDFEHVLQQKMHQISSNFFARIYLVSTLDPMLNILKI